jgi:hypothetical protein
MPRPTTFVIVLAMSTVAVDAQEVLRVYGGSFQDQQLGHQVAEAGDVDGDGVTDHLLAYKAGAGNGLFPGAVRVHSGATGVLIRTHFGQTGTATAGSAVTGIGDVDGDGHSDYAIGAATEGAQHQGSVRAYSGSTGAPLWNRLGDHQNQNLGRTMRRGPDLDGDGVTEVLASGMDQRVWVLSGATGVRVMELSDTNFGFGEALEAAGDLNGDGVGDILVGAPVALLGGHFSGFVRILSGATGSELYPALLASAPIGRFGHALQRLGDYDGDGAHEVAVSSPWEGPAGHVRVYSPRTGALIADLDGAHYGVSTSSTSASFGWSLALVGDVNGDGVQDLAIGAYYDVASNQGSLIVVSTDDFRLLFRSVASGSANYGQSIAAAGDTNGDGLHEVLVGVPLRAREAGQVEVVSMRRIFGATCAALPNSTGAAASLIGLGSSAVAAHGFSLLAGSLPFATTCYFIASRTAAALPQPVPNGGLLCLGGPVARLLATTGHSSGAGSYLASVDLTLIPEPPTFHVAVLPGETWHFQGWFRDTVGGVAQSNFTAGLRVQFD